MWDLSPNILVPSGHPVASERSKENIKQVANWLTLGNVSRNIDSYTLNIVHAKLQKVNLQLKFNISSLNLNLKIKNKILV